jgi:RNA polymerase sigma-70 factor (ECF subfamily)
MSALAKRTIGESSRVELDDLTLARAKRGDKLAFRQLVLAYQRPVFALLSRMLVQCGRQSLVEDLAQETFVRVYRALGTFGDDGRFNLSGWILTIAARLAVDELRRRQVGFDPASTDSLDQPGRGRDGEHQAGPSRELPAVDRADEALERHSLRAALERAVAGLSPDQRAVFLLREVHELPYEEIAEALEVDLGTVKSRLSRARACLRAALLEMDR